MHQHIITRRGTALAKRAALGAMVASALAAPAAMADEVSVRPGNNVTVFHNIDMVLTGGTTHAAGQPTVVEVIRNGHKVASTRGPASDGAEGVVFEVNHEFAGEGTCWTGGTPDIQPGDLIRVSNPNNGPGVDEIVVDNITIDTQRRVVANANSATPQEIVEGTYTVVTGTDETTGEPITAERDGWFPAGTTEFTEANAIADADPRDEVWLEGQSQFMTLAGVGAAIPPASLDSGFFRSSTGGDTRFGPNVVDAGALPNTYVARYFAPFNLERGNVNDVDGALDELADGDHEFGYGHVEGATSGQLVEGLGTPNGPGVGCETIAPAHGSSLGTVDQTVLNTNNAGPAIANGATVMTLGGWAANDVTSAAVQLTDGLGATKSIPVTGLAAAAVVGGPQQGWTATVTKGDLAGLAEGTLSMRLVTADGAGAGAIGATKTIPYSLTAPAFTVSLASGRYVGARSVAISRPEGQPQPSYRLNGGPLTPYDGTAIELPFGASTLVVSATDTAGNTTEQTFEYTIVRPAAPQPQPQQQTPQPQQQQQAPAPLVLAPAPQVAPSRLLPAATMLASQKRIKSKRARRKGLVSRFSAPSGSKTAVIRVYRSKNGKFTLVGSKTASVKRGTNKVKLNSKRLRRKFKAGLYAVQVTLRASDGAAGAPNQAFVRILK